MSNVILGFYTFSCLFFQHRFFLKKRSIKPVNWITIIYNTKTEFLFLCHFYIWTLAVTKYKWPRSVLCKMLGGAKC